MIRVAINGFGRIGRVLTRLIQEEPTIELVAINDLATPNTLAHLFKYDSVHGQFKGIVSTENNHLIINNKPVFISSESNPEHLPWLNMNIDIVIECTGKFKTKAFATKHLNAGAKKVIISAPSLDEDVKTVVIGSNDNCIDGSEEILSNASCTTNAAAPLIKILNEQFNIENVSLTTVHSYTNDQDLHDSPHKDLRRARAGAVSIIPTTTSASKAIVKVFPELENKIHGYAVRVPVPDGSLIDICATVKNIPTEEQVNNAFKHAAKNELNNILQYTLDPIVSVDVIGNSHSCVFDANLTVVNGNMIKVVGWYCNESGYSNRLIDLIKKVG